MQSEELDGKRIAAGLPNSKISHYSTALIMARLKKISRAILRKFHNGKEATGRIGFTSMIRAFVSAV
jgi:hypothetical protein